MNSYKSMTSPNEPATLFSFKPKNKNKWAQLIGITPSLHNFASGEGSVFGFKNEDKDLQFREAFISSCFNTISDKDKIISSSRVSFDEVLETDFTKSSVIICFKPGAKFEQGDSGDHWVSIVGYDATEHRLLLACSYTSHESGLTEKKDLVTRRVYNNTIKSKDFKIRQIYSKEIYKVCKKFT
jgi:hypothetical protein